jgi:plastocyanin
MNTALSKAIFGIGVALSIASIISIYVTMVAKQNQPSQGSAQVPSAVTNQPSNKTNTGSTTTTISIPQGAAAQQVKVYYLPNPTQVSVGSKITWINKDTAPHTATAIDGSFDTSLINAGSSGSAIIKGTGTTIQYHCTIHPWMTGILQTTS